MQSIASSNSAYRSFARALFAKASLRLARRVSEVDTQTDAFLDRPPTPLFVPHKTGVDIETQVRPARSFACVGTAPCGAHHLVATACQGLSPLRRS